MGTDQVVKTSAGSGRYLHASDERAGVDGPRGGSRALHSSARSVDARHGRLHSARISAGAAGYLLKDTSPADLERAIRAVERGETYFRLPRREYVTQSCQPKPSRFDRLTPRQREILQLIGEGHSTKGIANLLRISVKTAEVHRSQLMERLGMHEVTAVVRYAIAVGLVNPEL